MEINSSNLYEVNFGFFTENTSNLVQKLTPKQYFCGIA